MKKTAIIVIIVLLAFIGYLAIDSHRLRQEAKETIIKDFQPKTIKETMEEDKEQFIEGYLEGCISEDKSAKAYCECTADKLFEKYDIEEVMEFTLEMVKTDEIPDEMMEVAMPCIYLLIK